MVPVDPTATGFDRVADEYERARPDYPEAALEALVAHLGLGPRRRVVDVGAGTGRLTRHLVTQGAEVVAVEPLPGMRRRLAAQLPGVDLRAGTAEALPLADGDVDAAVAAQSFHWFDAPRALAELHRVLRPGSGLAVVHNRRDLASPVQAAIDELLAPFSRETPSWGPQDWTRPLAETDRFTGLRTLRFANAQELDAAGLVARVASISFVARLDEPARARVLAAIRALFDASERHGRVELRYVTELFLLRRVDDAG